MIEPVAEEGDQRLGFADIRRLFPYIARSAATGTGIGATPRDRLNACRNSWIYVGKSRYQKRKLAGDPNFGTGVPEGIAATEAANSSVSGANLIPVLSLGIPGNAAAVFLILAADSIGGFNPGPSVFKFTQDAVNPELVVAFGLFTAMLFANILNWTIGGFFMRSMGIMIRIPKAILVACGSVADIDGYLCSGNPIGGDLVCARIWRFGVFDAVFCDFHRYRS